jgi:hypothetical protein
VERRAVMFKFPTKANGTHRIVAHGYCSGAEFVETSQAVFDHSRPLGETARQTKSVLSIIIPVVVTPAVLSDIPHASARRRPRDLARDLVPPIRYRESHSEIGARAG